MRKRRLWALIGIVLLAALLRGWAVLRLPIDYDEPTYLEAAFAYARALRAGDLDAVIDYPGNREHPALGKLFYGLGVMALGEDPGQTVAGLVSRAVSAVMGTLAVLLLALLDPLAGGMLAVHTMAIKYTSQVYLEALPHLASIGAVLALSRVRAARDRWFWLSAVALGLTAAGKSTYLPILFPLLYLAIWEKRLRWHDLLLYGAAALAIFWALNPTLWHAPVERLFDSLTFHARYSQGAEVEVAALPWYQPLYWISRSPPSTWHPDVFFYFALDGPVFLLALVGLYPEWRRRRWVVVWIVAGLVVLLLWPTKWPQYTLVLTPALCLSASAALRWVYDLLHEHEDYLAWFRQMVPSPPMAFWIAIGALAVALAVGYTAWTLELTLGRLGWSHYTTDNTLLPSNTVYDLLGPAGPDDTGMVLATERGAAIWSPPQVTDLPDEWRLFTAENSGLPGDRVVAVARDPAGGIWFGTDGGVGRYDRGDWQTYGPADMDLMPGQVYALAVGADGRVWVGTQTGVAVREAGGGAWTAYTATNSGLGDNWVLALAVEPRPAGSWLWVGTRTGLSRLDTATGEWTTVDEDFGAGVKTLFLDAAGQLWAGTQGAGLARWDGVEWEFYRTGNSDIPFNTVNALAEVEPGVLWIGTARPAEVGGGLAEFDGERWKTLTARNSGFSGAEPLAFAGDARGRWWISTRTAGVDIYQRDR